MHILVLLKFTPLEFETKIRQQRWARLILLKFTPLEFETCENLAPVSEISYVKIYSVGV